MIAVYRAGARATHLRCGAVGGMRIRQDEAFAFAVVGAVLNVEVEPYDICGRQSAVDAQLHYPDGRTAALEVSSIGPEEEARITGALTGKQRRAIEGLRRTWLVVVPRNFNPKNFDKIDPALLRCEELGATRLDQTQGDSITDELIDLDVRAYESDPARGSDPIAWVILGWLGGFTSSGASNLSNEVVATLGTGRMRDKLTKLDKSGLDERHLFLHVRPSALSFPIVDFLTFGGVLPTDEPQLPAGLSQLWLVSGFKKGGVVRAIAGSGWSRADPFA